MTLAIRRRLLSGAAVALLGAVVGVVATGTPAHAANPTATIVKTSSWSTGFEARVTITNGAGAAVNGWSVAFDLPAGSGISSSWDANRSQSGQRFTFTNVGWNGTVAAGASVSFGFIGTGPGTPSNCTLNGAACTGGPTEPGAPGTPGNVRVGGTTAGSISLAWDASGGTVTGYRVYEGTTVRATVTGTGATISGLGTCTSRTYTVAAYNGNGESPRSGPVTGTTTGCVNPGGGRGAPYLYLGWGSPQSATSVMSATGVRWFTLAFVLSGGGCSPAWDGQRPLLGGVDQQTINAIRGAGGDIVPSFGGWSGNKLGPNCATPEALAGAYQQVINAYGLKAIDIDIENSDEFENEVVQDRIITALRIVKQNNPGIQTIVTFGTSTTGPNYYGTRLINRSRELNANIDVFTIMPFDFGGSNMQTDTISAAEGLKNALKTAFGWSDATAYQHMGLSGMNGLSDQREVTTPAAWTAIRDWAKARGLARLAYWSVNRDRSCPGNAANVQADCSGIVQGDLEFTRITAGF
jgi:hypothetical protein